LYFSSSTVVSRAFSVHVHAMRIFDAPASSSPLGYPCAKFHFWHPPLPSWPADKLLTHQLIWSAENRNLSLRNSYPMMDQVPTWLSKKVSKPNAQHSVSHNKQCSQSMALANGVYL